MATQDKNYKVFLSKLRKARQDCGLTQTQVADKLKKKQSYVSKCESGERRVDVVELKEFAHIYKKSVSYFA